MNENKTNINWLVSIHPIFSKNTNIEEDGDKVIFYFIDNGFMKYQVKI